MASAFLRKYAFITAVDLIQWKKLDFWNFYESNLAKARLLILYCSIRIMTVIYIVELFVDTNSLMFH